MMSITNPDKIRLFRLQTLRRGLKSEVEDGMQLCRGRSAYSIVKSEFGFRGNKKKVLAQFEAFLKQEMQALNASA